MRRMSVRLVAGALVALCLAAGAPAAVAAGGKTIAEAPSLKLDAPLRGELYDSAFYSGYSVAFWTGSFTKGDRISIRTTASEGDTPPCQLLYMPGTDDLNVGATTPLLDPADQTRDGSRDFQRFATATETGTYVLAMTNADIFLSGEHQCLDAPSGRPFTFRVSVDRGDGGKGSDRKGGSGDGSVGGAESGGASTHVVAPGQSLWAIAESLFGGPASIAQVAFKVQRLWQLNAARIGTGNPDLIYPGQELRLK